jgi:hypothetical protein
MLEFINLIQYWRCGFHNISSSSSAITDWAVWPIPIRNSETMNPLKIFVSNRKNSEHHYCRELCMIRLNCLSL